MLKFSNVYYFISEEKLYFYSQKEIVLSSEKKRFSANTIWLLNQEEIKQPNMVSSCYKRNTMATGQKIWVFVSSFALSVLNLDALFGSL